MEIGCLSMFMWAKGAEDGVFGGLNLTPTYLAVRNPNPLSFKQISQLGEGGNEKKKSAAGVGQIVKFLPL